jgi:hypothetical protein
MIHSSVASTTITAVFASPFQTDAVGALFPEGEKIRSGE